MAKKTKKNRSLRTLDHKELDQVSGGKSHDDVIPGVRGTGGGGGYATQN